MKKLYLAWQDRDNRQWYPVGCLTFDNNMYRFAYTKGAGKSPRFIPFGRMTNLKAVYESDELFPLFANRLLSKSRPEYKDYLKWLELEDDNNNPLDMLALTEGLRGTDSLEVFQCPIRTKDGKYEVRFFSHGIRHLPEYAINRVNNLKTGEKLFLMRDIQNPHHSLAIALRTNDPIIIIGYCPRYLSDDFNHIIDSCGGNCPEVTVSQVNTEAPSQLRLLCKFKSIWPESFQPCSTELYQELAC